MEGYLIFIALGILVGVFSVVRPPACIFLIAIFAFVVNGSVMFFLPQYATIRWGTAILSLILFMSIFIHVDNRIKGLKLPPPIIYMILFFLTALISVVLNFNFYEALIASKNYFQFWSIPISFFFLALNGKFIRRMGYFFIILAFVQVPFSLTQYFMYRNVLFIGDRISGTFGGIYGMPGGSAEMALFMCSQIALVLSLYKYKLINIYKVLFMMSVIIIPVIFTHAKIVLVILPIIYIIVAGKDIFKNIGKSILSVVLVGILSVTLLVYYVNTSNLYNASRTGASSVSEFIDDSISYNINSNKSKVLTRLSSILFWGDKNIFSGNLLNSLVGHGLGAVKQDAGLTQGHLVQKPEYSMRGLGVTTFPRLLWEVGIIGVLFYIMIYLSAYRLAAKLEYSRYLSSGERAFILASKASCFIILVTLPYNSALINNQAFSAFSMFVVGYIVFAYKQSRLRIKANRAMISETQITEHESFMNKTLST